MKKNSVVTGIVIIIAVIAVTVLGWKLWPKQSATTQDNPQPAASAVVSQSASPSLQDTAAPSNMSSASETAVQSKTSEISSASETAAAASVAGQPSANGTSFDFSGETVGEQPKTFIPVVGNWEISDDGGNKVLAVDGTKWQSGQTAAGIADQARALYGDKYAEFLDNVTAFAYYPYALAAGIDNFNAGEISLRFKTISGKVDQNMGILFDMQPNGDYLTIRAAALENNLVLWDVVKGQRTSLLWINDVKVQSGQWHTLKMTLNGKTVEGYLDDQLYLTYELDHAVSGKVGAWSKSDSYVYMDDFTVKQQ